MTSAKALFQSKKPGELSLAEWWVSVIHDARFPSVLACTRAHIMESQPLTQDQVRGTELAMTTLMTLAENEDEGSGYLPQPGLIHRIVPPTPPTPKES